MSMHPTQVSILRTLRHIPSARYTDLRLPTKLDSDVFKFHLSKLAGMNYVRRLESGKYELTATGKEFANNLSKLQPSIQKQPKLSVAVIAVDNTGDTTKYLLQQRLRNPYYGFWSCITGPVQWGESFEAAARREFEKQSGVSGQYGVKGFYRKMDFTADDNGLLEDKLFVIVEVSDLLGEASNTWSKGANAWMTVQELKLQKHYFASSITFITMINSDTPYLAGKNLYKADEY